MPSRSVSLFAALIIAVAAGPAVAQQEQRPFDRLDRNSDGKLTRDELPPGLRNAFDRIDADKDGSISRDEDRAFRRRAGAIGQFQVPENVEAKLDLSYAGTDHPRQRLDLYLPKARKSDTPLPLIAFIHGGAWLGGDKRGAGGQVIRFAANGQYVAASIGYRLSGDAIWPAQIHDCKAAIRWLRAHAAEYGIDPERIGVMGSSAGGHLVAMLGTSGDVEAMEGDLGDADDQSSRVTCVVDLYGPADMLTIGDYPSQLDHKAANSPESRLIGGAVLENKDAARSASPVAYISKDDPPFLIIHGSNDQTVPYHQSVELDEQLTQAGVRSLFITIDGGGHGGFRSDELDQRVKAFFDLHLLGKEATISEEAIPQGGAAAE
jgi:acetyl esterase/lipase